MIFIGVAFAFLLAFTNSINRTANRFLAFGLVTMILWMIRILAIDVNLQSYLPQWDRLPMQFLLALGPLIYFYVLKITRPGYKFRWMDMLHFSPLIIEQIVLALEISEGSRRGVVTYATHTFALLNPVLQLLIFVSLITYLYKSHRLIENFYRRLQPVLMDRSRLEFRWLRRLLAATALLWVLWIAYAAVDYFGYRNQLGVHVYYPFYIFFVAIIIWTAAAAFLKPQAGIAAQSNVAPKPSPSVELRGKGAWLKRTIEANLYYQDPELSVGSLAKELNIPPHELSRIINIALKKSFSDFINEYRIRDIVQKMQDPAYDRMTLLGIAFESGFNSKTNFNRTFRQVTGKSPAEYKNDLKKERPFCNTGLNSASRPVVLHGATAFEWSPVKINRITMFRNYLKLAWRNTARNISYSAINIIGLAAGLCSFIVILLYINYELSYDKWNPELSKVYRVSLREHEDILNTTPAPLAGFLAQKYPNAEAATMIQSSGDYECLIAAGETRLFQKNVVTVDSNFLKVFPYQLEKGVAATALNNPKAAILTAELSHKLFGNEDPIGKQLKIYDFIDLVVTGVLKNQPGATHLPVEMLMRSPHEKSSIFWQNYSYQTYIKLKQPASDTSIETAINRLYYYERIKKPGTSFGQFQKAGAVTSLFVDQAPRIHNFPKHGSSNFATVTILLALAVLLLLAGAINFSNLAVARSISRAKEVGIRKVVGSGRRQLILQFMLETTLQCFISLMIAIILLAITLPYINRSFNINLGFLQQHELLRIAAQLGGCLLAIILLSGSYPAVYLSRFNAVKVLKGNYSTGKKGTLFRNSLIVVQFMVSVFFITGIIVIKSQMTFMQTKDKGFSGEQLIRIPSTQNTRDKNFNDTRNILLSIPGVASVAKTTKVPGDNMFADTGTVSFKNNGKIFRMSSVKVSTDYFKTLQVPLKRGRLFTDELPDQQTRTAVINEAAARKLNLANPVGENIAFPDCDSIPVRIVGIVKDFNVQGFESEIQPVVYTIGNKACMFQSGGAILVKLDSRHAQQSIAGITQAWKKIEPAFPLRYSFVDQNFKQLFISYVRLEKIITFFGIVAIMISVMGLFALTAFFTRQRTKEIGVRKVLGASVLQLTTLLSRDFIYLVLLSVLIIMPFTWWMVQKWLQTFAYRIDISWWMFFAAGVTAVFIAVTTVSFQSVKAALANPADSLRSE